MTKLTEAEVSEIRLARMQGQTLRALADKYGLSISTVWAIVNNQKWKNVAPVICPHCHHAI